MGGARGGAKRMAPLHTSRDWRQRKQSRGHFQELLLSRTDPREFQSGTLSRRKINKRSKKKKSESPSHSVPPSGWRSELGAAVFTPFEKGASSFNKQATPLFVSSQDLSFPFVYSDHSHLS